MYYYQQKETEIQFLFCALNCRSILVCHHFASHNKHAFLMSVSKISAYHFSNLNDQRGLQVFLLEFAQAESFAKQVLKHKHA